MKILFVGSGNSKKGISSILQNQADSLIGIGLEVDIFTIKGKGIIGYIKNILPLRKTLQHQQYSIIHAHYSLSGIISLIARRNEKIIISYMGSDLVGTLKTDKSLTLLEKLNVKFNVFLSKYFYDFTIVKSEEMLSKLKTSKIELVPNGLNLNKFYQTDKESAITRTNFKRDEINILFLSNPTREEKNFRLAKRAVELIHNAKVQLHVIYNVDNEELIYYYNAADVLILTSLHEGSPNVIKEAMACNTPIVSTKVGDIEWIIGHTEGCYLSSFEPEDLACKIEFAIQYSKTKGYTQGRNRIIELGLDAETVALKIKDLYEKVFYQ